jgi:hypothetical protein
MLDIILTRMDLVEDEMPESFIDFCSHVTGLAVTLAQWQDGNYLSLALVTSILVPPLTILFERDTKS